MKDTVDQVIEDMVERKELGLKRYGQALSTRSNYDTLYEAYMEALDLAIYLRCEIEKRGEEHLLSKNKKI